MATLGLQVLFAIGLLAGGTYIVIDTIRDSSRFAISAGDDRIALGGLCVFVGSVIAAFALMPLN